jgi:hypothetical protein
MEKLRAQMARREFALYEFPKECQLKPDGIAESVKHITERTFQVAELLEDIRRCFREQVHMTARHISRRWRPWPSMHVKKDTGNG